MSLLLVTVREELGNFFFSNLYNYLTYQREMNRNSMELINPIMNTSDINGDNSPSRGGVLSTLWVV